MCSSQRLCNSEDCDQCREKSFASHDKAKFWSQRNKVRPRDVFKSSNKKFWFDCENCGHEFDISLGDVNRGKGRWCSYCASKKLCKVEDCEQCRKKSFASHEKAIFWSDKNEKKPRDVFLNTKDTYLFDCNDCKHTFDSLLLNITKGQWCPYCAHKRLCDDNGCDSCFENSFDSCDKARLWSDQNPVKPRNIFKSSDEKCWFNCDKCQHTFDITLSNVKAGFWCSYCSNQKLCSDNDCKICIEKSFDSCDKARFWSDKNEKKPRDVFKSSHTQYLFNCDKNHLFPSSLANVTNGSWCPFCINKTEQKLYEQLSVRYPTLQRQFRVEWCKKKRCLPYDFVIPEYKIIIELDGRQHFIQVANWPSPEEQQENDKYKEQCANDHGYSVIRLTQEEVSDDMYDWLNELDQKIKMIIEGGTIRNIYMSHMNHYDHHM